MPSKWVSSLSNKVSLEAALEDVVYQACAQLEATATLGFIYVSSAFTSEYSRLMPLLTKLLPNVPLIGCSGGGIIGTQADRNIQEAEMKWPLVWYWPICPM